MSTLYSKTDDKVDAKVIGGHDAEDKVEDDDDDDDVDDDDDDGSQSEIRKEAAHLIGDQRLDLPSNVDC